MAAKNPKRLRSLVGCTAERGKLEINENALQEIRKIQKPLVVITALGQFKSGKSHLLNQLFLDKGDKDKFDVGHGLDPTTTGICCHVIDHPKIQDCELVILETEGFRKIFPADRDVENIISAIALCMSSAIIWNGKSTISESDVKQIGLACKLASEVFQARNPREPSSVPATTLVYAVQDFSLKRKLGGRYLTEDGYLEETLKIDSKEDENSIPALSRKLIKDTFRQRRCFTVPLPVVGDSKKLRHLNNLEEQEISSEYRSKIEDIRAFLLSSVNYVGIGDRVLTGEVWADLLQQCVEITRTGSIPKSLDVQDVPEPHHSFRKLTESLITERSKEEEARYGEITRELKSRVRSVGYEPFKSHSMCTDRFVTAVLGEKGGLIKFADVSVKLDVPPRALRKPTAVYCHRLTHVMQKPRDYIHYSIPIRCGPEDAVMNRPIQLSFRHFAEIEDKRQEDMIRVLTKKHQDQLFQVNQTTQIEVEDEWIKLRVPEFCDVVIGVDRPSDFL